MDAPKPAIADLLPVVYDQLRALARRRVAEAGRPCSLQPTALVHEAYLRLAGAEDASWHGREHVLAAAAQVIRWILVDRARRRTALRRGGGERAVTLDEADPRTATEDRDVLALDEALRRLKQRDPRQHDVVQLRYFVGLSIEETAQALAISKATVKRDWSFARAWLLVHLRGADQAAP